MRGRVAGVLAFVSVLCAAALWGGVGVALADGTFGNTAVGSDWNGASTDDLEASGPFVLAEAGSVSELDGYFAWGSTASVVRGVIYADSGGAPGALVAATPEVSLPTTSSDGWVSLPFTGSVALPAGSYWLGYWYGDGNSGHAFTTQSGSAQVMAETYSATADPSSTFETAFTWSEELSVYATYTASSGSAPSNTGLPAISGDATVGQTLATTDGQWTGSPTSFAYQWQRCDSGGVSCTAILGASAASYQLTPDDAGSTLRAVVTATNDAGSADATSDATAVVASSGVPVNTTLPAISGTAEQGQTLSVDTGSWDNSPTGYAYQWQRCDSSGNNCVDISGATSNSYDLVAADVGSTLRATVTATNNTGPATATTAATGVVSAGAQQDTFGIPRWVGLEWGLDG